jgi:hypothetical protein
VEEGGEEGLGAAARGEEKMGDGSGRHNFIASAVVLGEKGRGWGPTAWCRMGEGKGGGLVRRGWPHGGRDLVVGTSPKPAGVGGARWSRNRGGSGH